MEENSIELEHVSKSFKIYTEKIDTFFDRLKNPFKKDRFLRIPILQDANFSIKKGEMFGIIGRNGMGKTTLLKLIAGIYKSDYGKIRTYGNLVPLLELGIGFNPERTARNNIILYGKILGFSGKEIESKVDNIIKFAELEDFADTIVRNFSAGMFARLAFSTAMQVNPDILLVDEILSVGDLSFQKKSFDAFNSLRKNKKTIVYVSHNLPSVSELCDRVLVLNDGKIEFIGNPDEAIEIYKIKTK